MRRRIDFCFKGERVYIQGPDLVEGTMREVLSGEATGQVSNLVFVMNRLTGRNLDLVIDEEAPLDRVPVARLSFEAHGVPRRGSLLERADRPAGRRPYDEHELRTGCRMDLPARAVMLQRASPLTPIETLVAMTKALHLALYPASSGQWLFARLEAPTWPLGEPGSGLQIELRQALGTRLTKSAARLCGNTLAWIYFSLKERT